MIWLPICLHSLIFNLFLQLTYSFMRDGGFGGCNASLLGLRRISRGGAYGDSSVLRSSVVKAVGLTASTLGVERIDGYHCLCYCRREIEPLEMTL